MNDLPGMDSLSRVIWKFELPWPGAVFVRMPAGARILSVHAQAERPMLWAMVDQAAPKVRRKLLVLETGVIAPSVMYETEQKMDDAAFVGTVLLLGGTYVIHVFDFGEAP